MEIMQAEDTLVCTNRSFGLQHMSLRELLDRYGKVQVAVDPVGVARITPSPRYSLNGV